MGTLAEDELLSPLSNPLKYFEKPFEKHGYCFSLLLSLLVDPGLMLESIWPHGIGAGAREIRNSKVNPGAGPVAERVMEQKAGVDSIGKFMHLAVPIPNSKEQT